MSEPLFRPTRLLMMLPKAVKALADAMRTPGRPF